MELESAALWHNHLITDDAIQGACCRAGGTRAVLKSIPAISQAAAEPCAPGADSGPIKALHRSRALWNQLFVAGCRAG